ncbi:aminomethyl-transferring glycine dehydrogenase [Methylococcus sp. EFPC2]|uniref:aminomethyl-transferring glycine dehydrogenase n=1 Tax=Methylococcus sp. EFPC2 TaxID=2812648 RepID=UPI0019686A8F|nr:aminomethyl-transferring glycine dehydrogenase [Methylococcus sp. EFPC2]QSA97914.1 aminomethyl-transferring glycine dehydrogenase [Methylococcus sp. EFPC2]
MLNLPLAVLERRDEFMHRHIGPDEDEVASMLAALGLDSLDQLMNEAVPAGIRLAAPLPLGPPVPEQEALARLRAMAAKNRVQRSLIGLGYYGTYLPKVILRNVLENPGWYTAYTPYQAEIAQGRLEALSNWQQMVIDLSGLELANASLLDEATAAAEAMSMARRVSASPSRAFFVDAGVFPQTQDVLKTRAKYFGFDLIFGAPEEAGKHAVFGALLQYPDRHGEVRDLTGIIAGLKSRDAITAVATDLMALVLLKSPGAMGADIALGSAQRFGLPLGFGGPHAAFFAVRDEYKRAVPGRIIGVSIDARGKPALRMALQTREQHIRREKATSNICTSQVLLANLAGLYAVWHGPEGLRSIALRIHRLAALFAAGMQAAGYSLLTRYYFDTLDIATGDRTASLHAAAGDLGYNLRRVSENALGVSFDETSSREDLAALFQLFGVAADPEALDIPASGLPADSLRSDPILRHPVFNRHRTEHKMLRYLKRLQNRDLALDHSMIPLGSCTMKLTATSEMLALGWPEFADLHPYAPREQALGYLEMMNGLAGHLRAITGFPAISLQPNSGALGEYAGLVLIRRYHEARGETHRDVCLIPRSAHGTNPASAAMCGLQVVTVDCDERGNIDISDLEAKAGQYRDRLAALMITYPSTHGVFEAAVKEICAAVHRRGGQVYMDGANLNAQLGLTSPAALGADVCHINLHKTFCIPHGGGGPGMGPIALASHLAPYMPDHAIQPTGASDRPNAGQGAVAATPYGSPSILTISWMYITMMGGAGLARATRVAILNANYLATRLAPLYPVLYTGERGRVAHECIFDIRPIKAASGIGEVDIAKRLMDYGFHAPTVSFPVPGTLMVEPTESESKDELDRFVAALSRIREEIDQVERGVWPADDNPLKRAPHTQADVIDAEWNRPYNREEAVFPLAYVRENKFWPSVNRIDEVYGDRHLCFGCLPASEASSD